MNVSRSGFYKPAPRDLIFGQHGCVAGFESRRSSSKTFAWLTTMNDALTLPSRCGKQWQ